MDIIDGLLHRTESFFLKKGIRPIKEFPALKNPKCL